MVGLCPVCTYGNYATAAQYYFAQEYVPLASLFYVISALLDKFILLDRISIVKNCIKLGPYKICLVLFLVAVVIEIPDDLENMPFSASFPTSPNQTFIILFLNNTAVLYLLQCSMTVYFVRDLGGLIAQILLNLASVYLLKAHFNKRKRIMSRPGASTAPTAATNATSQSVRSTSVRSSRKNVSSAEANATVMVTVMCVVSAIQNLVTLLGYMYSIFNIGFTTFILYRCIELCWVTRCVVDILLFYAFN